MIDRLFGNWKTTIAALIIIVGILVLIGMDKIHFNDVSEMIMAIVGTLGAGALALSKDPKKKDKDV